MVKNDGWEETQRAAATGRIVPRDWLQGTLRLFDDEDDNSRSIRCEDTMHQRDHWTTCHDETQGM